MRRLGTILTRAMSGGLNVTKDVTLTANQASTTVTDPRATYDSALVFEPMTANAAAELAAGTMYVTQANRLAGSFVITHANNAQADRIFRMVIVG
jgi:hypothetical protein